MEQVVKDRINQLSVTNAKKVIRSLGIGLGGARTRPILRERIINNGPNTLTVEQINSIIAGSEPTRSELVTAAQQKGIEVTDRDNKSHIQELIKQQRIGDYSIILHSVRTELPEDIDLIFIASKYLIIEGSFRFSIKNDDLQMQDRAVLNLSGEKFVGTRISKEYSNSDIAQRTEEMSRLIRSLIEKIRIRDNTRVTFSLRQKVLIQLKEDNEQNAEEYAYFNIISERVNIANGQFMRENFDNALQGLFNEISGRKEDLGLQGSGHQIVGYGALNVQIINIPNGADQGIGANWTFENMYQRFTKNTRGGLVNVIQDTPESEENCFLNCIDAFFFNQLQLETNNGSYITSKGIQAPEGNPKEAIINNVYRLSPDYTGVWNIKASQITAIYSIEDKYKKFIANDKLLGKLDK